MLENSCIYSKVPAEANYHTNPQLRASFHSLCCLMNRKSKSFEQTAFLLE